MCSVAVDFAKHGECVSQKNYAEFKKERTKSFAQKHVSVRILGTDAPIDVTPEFECYRCIELGA